MKVVNIRERKDPLPEFDLDGFIDVLAVRIAAKIIDRLPTPSAATGDPLLLTVEQAAGKLGRTAPAVEHLIREGTLPVVRFDRRVFVDFRDLLLLIEQHKATRN